MSSAAGRKARVAFHAAAGLAALAALPLGAAALLARPRWRVGLLERLGGRPGREAGAIWVHAAGLGEMRAATRLLDQLLESGHSVCTSTTGLKGRDVIRRSRPDLPCHLAPLDHPWCVEAALARISPAALVLVETELWPAWIAAARRRGIPVLLVSARLSDRSFPRYRRLARFLAPTLGRLHAVGARTPADAARFRSLGTPPERVSVTGDLKLDVDENPPPLAPDLDRLLGEVPLLVAGSTHPGEERAAVDALELVEREGAAAGLVLAPRHPERSAELVRLLRARNRPWRRRTRPGEKPLAPGEVLVLDSIGELASLYARARVAFVGGTLVPVGGHNLLEPVSAGRPVLFGPHTENVRHAVEILESCGAGRCVSDAAELGAAFLERLRAPSAAGEIGAAGARELREHRGSAERTLRLVLSALDPV
jgi:3-deoxy-D-manno-octulosonic-acid transferase